MRATLIKSYQNGKYIEFICYISKMTVILYLKLFTETICFNAEYEMIYVLSIKNDSNFTLEVIYPNNLF